MTDDHLETVICEAADGAGVTLAGNQQKNLAIYLKLLDRWNQKLNLVSRKQFWPAVADRMFDALMIWREFQPWGGKLHLDVGSGNGFPAIPIHVMSPTERLTLMEPRRKRAGFLSAAVAQLQFKDIEVRCERLDGEREFSVPLAMFDVVTAQAVRPFAEMASLVLGQLAGDGRFVWVASRPLSDAERGGIDGREGRFTVMELERSRPDGSVCWVGAVEKCL
jgi:16S rRNA (guanine527-N7)-methyltransferase